MKSKDIHTEDIFRQENTADGENKNNRYVKTEGVLPP